VNTVEVLQIITLAFVAFVWTEIRELRKDAQDDRKSLADTNADVAALQAVNATHIQLRSQKQ
jgi:hypothetical protein